MLRTIREKSKQSQESVASLLGKDQSQISRIERGLEEIRFSEINKVCEYFNVGLVDFVAKIKYSK